MVDIHGNEAKFREGQWVLVEDNGMRLGQVQEIHFDGYDFSYTVVGDDGEQWTKDEQHIDGYNEWPDCPKCGSAERVRIAEEWGANNGKPVYFCDRPHGLTRMGYTFKGGE